jgi:hypothetical protein
MSAVEIENEASCAICLDLFNDPRLLPCTHSFCVACLKANSIRQWHHCVAPRAAPRMLLHRWIRNDLKNFKFKYRVIDHLTKLFVFPSMHVGVLVVPIFSR